MIDLLPNSTILWQWLIFLGAFVTLWLGVFSPILRILDARRDRTGGERLRTEKLREEVTEMIARCEGRLAEARAIGIREKDSLRHEGERRRAELLKAARSETEGRQSEVRSSIDQSAREAALKLGQDALAFSREIASRVLEREV